MGKHTFFFKRYKEISRKQGSGQLSKVTAEFKAHVEKQMCTDDETTVHQLHKFLLIKTKMPAQA